MATASQVAGAMRGRAVQKLKRSQAPRKPPKPKKHRLKAIPLQRFLNAVPGSTGILTVIAERVGCTYMTVWSAMKRWPELVEAVEVERERLGDVAQQAVEYAIQQRLDVGTSARTACWVLSRPRYAKRGMADESKVTVEGGEHPIRHEGVVLLDTLNLPVEMKRSILEQMDRQRQEAKESSDVD